MDGSGHSPVRSWLQALYDERGYLTPEIVREAARDEESPGHLAVFGVSVVEAAEGFYLDRAHKLIQSVRIITVPQDEREPVTLRAYHAVPGNSERSYVYRSIDDLAREPDQMELARNEAKRRLNGAESALRSLDAIAVGPTSKRTKRAMKNIQAAQKAIAAD